MDILTEILKDRERRFALRQAITERGLSSISLNFNVPGYPKSSVLLQRAFALVKKDLQRYFIAHRIHCEPDTRKELHSDCGDFFLQGVSYAFQDNEVKVLLENFEQTHLLGRLLDVDLMNAKGKLIGSGKHKKCFLCEKPAKECMKDQSHTFPEYSEYVKGKIGEYLKKKRRDTVIAQIAESALKATLFEVSVKQKPGLVCPDSNGAHKDMDYFTFLASSSSLANYWEQFAAYGYEMGEYQTFDSKSVRIQLRIMGLAAEEAMFIATQGVNTQKGIIFLMGLGCFAAAFVFAKQDNFIQEDFRYCVREIMKNVVNEDFERGYAKQGTHGETAYNIYGKHLAGGARYEAEQGFPSVFDYAIEYLTSQTGKQYHFLKKEDWQDVLTDLLLLLISKSNDVNILYRKDAEALRDTQCRAARVLAMPGGEAKNKALQTFSEHCMLHNISPGGAADLLVLSLFVYFIQDLQFSDFSMVI